MLAGLIQFYLGQNKIIQEDVSKKTKRLNFNDWRSITFLSLINIPIILLIFEINKLLHLYIYAELFIYISNYFIFKEKK